MYGLWYTILSNIFRLVSNQYSNRIDDDDDDNDDRFIAVRDVYMCMLCCVLCVWKTTRRKRINIAFSSSLYFVSMIYLIFNIEC